jgi:hypothetical protein
MKKKSGFLMLLLVCFLVFMPVTAFAYEAAGNGYEMFFTLPETTTKIEAQEDVVVTYFIDKRYQDFESCLIESSVTSTYCLNHGTGLCVREADPVPLNLRVESLQYMNHY